MTRLQKALGYASGAALVLGGGALLLLFKTGKGFRFYLDRVIGKEFTDVPFIDAETLAGEMMGDRPPLVLDARTPEEFAVSHLRNAQLVADGSFDPDELDDIDRDRAIVVYCSVGYRGGLLARHLLEHGFSDVRNLYGGIFDWYNSGLPVYRDESMVEQVHPGSGAWGQFITRPGRARHVGEE